MLISIYVEGKKYIVEDSKNVLEACLSIGFDIPYFCWHPALGSVGSCRQCAVKQYYGTDNTHSRLIMSCMTPVSNEMFISIVDKEAQDFRKNILELLMINHPHDCPVCEEGGNCHLQDMIIMGGHVHRRYRFAKRTHNNQYLGPFIAHEMNRCITCYRCVRYYRDYAGGDDFGVFGIHDNIYFGRLTDGMLQSEFSGNLIEICPTGVFTDKTQSKNFTRKWDIIFAPSICHQCSVGCNIIVGERYGKLCRVENRYNNNINGYFLCDRGRFGCDYVTRDDRPTQPIQKDGKSWIKLNETEAIDHAVDMLKSNDNNIIGIGSSRASLESNFALRKLVGADNFYTGINHFEQECLLLILQILSDDDFYIPSANEIETYDAILILGEDVTQTSARIALSIRQAVKRKSYKMAEGQDILQWHAVAVLNLSQRDKHPLLITGVDKTKLDDIAVLTYYDSVQNQARFGFAVAHALDRTAPAVKDFDCKLQDQLSMAVQILIKARKPLIISGSSSGSKELIAAAANIARSLKNCKKEVGITLIVSDVNSIGLVMIGKKSLNDALISISNSNDSSVNLIILENDLYRNASVMQINQALAKVNYLIVLDHQYNLIQEKADLVLPAASFVESDGTVINYEGRAQRFFRIYNPQFYNKDMIVLESWRWLYLICDAYLEHPKRDDLHLDHVIDEIVYCFPELIGVKYTAPNASFRIRGQKLAQAPHRYSGRTAMYTHLSIHEPCISHNNETMFTFSMEGSHDAKSLHQQIAFVWAPGWNSPQAWNKFQEQVGGRLHSGDPGICVLQKKNSAATISATDNNNVDNLEGNSWFTMIPKSFKVVNQEKWLIVPYWHLFGSEETSQRSKFIKESMIEPYITLSISDAIRLNIQEDMLVRLQCMDQIIFLPLKISNNLPIGHVGIPVGFPGIPVFFIGMYAQDVQIVEE